VTPDLPWLLGARGTARFFAQDWERRPLVLHRRDPAFYRELLNLRDLDVLVAAAHGGAEQRRDLEVHGSRRARGGGTAEPSSLEDPYAQHARGRTLVVNGIEQTWEPVGALCRALAVTFACRVNANAYLTPKAARGFPAHFDLHDVFVLQLHGEKRWRLFDGPIKLPTRDLFDSPSLDLSRSRQTVTLTAGDLLYLPRGIVHEAQTSSHPSLHLTVGVHVTTVEDLVVEMLHVLGERELVLRRALPIDSPARLRAPIQRALRALGSERLASLARDRLARRRFVELSQPIRGRFARLADDRPVTAGTALRRRPGMPCRVSRAGRVARLRFPGNELHGPAKLEPALRHIARRPAFMVRELPGLTTRAQILLARRLMELGLLERDERGVGE
jgi:ribosomal protein L16 Arg81 hydroxylase